MKKNFFTILLASYVVGIFLSSCNSGVQQTESTTNETQVTSAPGQSGVRDEVSEKNIVGIAVGSPDHTTLVKAVQAAKLVDVLSNPGPFTVFAPTNAAFDKLPKGTLDELLKPEKIMDLQNILQYHVFVGVVKTEDFKDGETLNQVNLDNVTLGVKDGKYQVNGANILASIPASNGIIHVIDAVLLPPQK